MKSEFCKSISLTRDLSRAMEFVSGGKTENFMPFIVVISCYVFVPWLSLAFCFVLFFWLISLCTYPQQKWRHAKHRSPTDSIAEHWGQRRPSPCPRCWNLNQRLSAVGLWGCCGQTDASGAWLPHAVDSSGQRAWPLLFSSCYKKLALSGPVGWGPFSANLSGSCA